MKELPDDSVEVLKRNNLDRYTTNTTFKNGKYAMLNRFCYAEFLSYYYLDTKPLKTNNDWQPEVIGDDDNEQPFLYPRLIPLMFSKEKMRCRNTKNRNYCTHQNAT